MADDDEHTPAESPRTRRISSVAIGQADLICEDVRGWAEHAAGVRLPEVPAALRERVAARIAAGARDGGAVERTECDRLRAELATATALLATTESQLAATQRELGAARNHMRTK